MKDAFAAFGFQRRPFVDLHELQEQYLSRAALLHPDRPGGDAHAFAELGTARALLEDPAERLQHLLQLQGEKSIAYSSTNEMQEMMEVTSLLWEVKQYISKLQSSLTPLAQAILIQSGREYLARLEKAKERIRLILEYLNKEIQTADQAWPDIPLSQLAQVANSWRFVQKKGVQVSESLFQLQSTLMAF